MKSSLLKISFFALLPFGLISCKGQSQDETGDNKEKPNVLILFADDLGYTDVNCYGGIASTPHIDSLANNGIQFTDCYAAAPNCSPSRAGILTGRHPSRVGIYSYIPGGRDHPMHLQGEEVTLAELLKEQGYQTAHFGKWHLGCLGASQCEQPKPSDQGFDYSLATENNAQPSHFNPVNFVRNGKALDTLEGYSCQLVVDEAEMWLNDHYDDDKPFFIYTCFHEVHKKVASPPELVAKYSEYPKNDAEYYANVENMDLAIGRLVNILRKKGELENTLIFFTSDNGSYHQGSQKGLRGYKGEVYDGGIKVPGIIYWPERIQESRKVKEPVWGPDILPTVCDIVDISLPERTIDGVSLEPLLNNEDFQREKPMLWYFYRSNPEAAMRIGDYSLMAYTEDSVPRTHYFSERDMSFIKDSEFKSFELYNLEKDPGQKHDLADAMPEKLDSMKAVFRKNIQNVMEEGPYWEDLPEYNADQAQLKWKYERHRED